MASYQEIANRYDAANHRIDGLLTSISTVTLAAPLIVAATSNGATLKSPLMVVAAILFALVLVVGVIGRGFVGGMTLIAPSDLYSQWLGLCETDFKLSGVYWAGQHFDKSARVIWWKSQMAHIMTGLFLAEVVVLLVWISNEL